MTGPYICTVPWAPPSFNVYNNWKPCQQREQKRLWQHAVSGLVNQKGNVAPRGLARAEVKAVIQFTTDRGRDLDNYYDPMWKWTLDALRAAGVLVNDTDKHVLPHVPKLVLGDVEQTVIMILEVRE